MTEYEIRAPLGKVIETIKTYHEYDGPLHKPLMPMAQKYFKLSSSEPYMVKWVTNKGEVEIAEIYDNSENSALTRIILNEDADKDNPLFREGQIILGSLLSFIGRAQQ